MTEYTPGPWKWDGDVLLQDRPYPQLYVGLMDAGPVDAHYREGNRNLISAAPELLEIAKEMRHRLADQIGVPLEKCVGGFFKRWDEIIAKAEATNA